jgi:prevent-host-death family protein
MKVLSSREFNQDVSAAKRLARDEPVFVTDRGRPTHVLMSIRDFRALSGQRDSIVDLLAWDGADAVAEQPSDPWLR